MSLSIPRIFRLIIKTPVGPMTASSDEKYLASLEFGEKEASMVSIEPLESIKYELELYFAKKLRTFKTPMRLRGTPFQEKVWRQLQTIPYGATCSYKELLGGASRAVGSANGANKLAIIIPCHRVIRSDGSLRGYAGGCKIKQWLLEHESSDQLASSFLISK